MSVDWSICEHYCFWGTTFIFFPVAKSSTCFSDRVQCDAQLTVASTPTVRQGRGMRHPCIFSWCVSVVRANLKPSLSLPYPKCSHFPFKWLVPATEGNGRRNQRLRTSVGIIKHSLTQCANHLALSQTRTHSSRRYKDKFLNNVMFKSAFITYRITKHIHESKRYQNSTCTKAPSSCISSKQQPPTRRIQRNDTYECHYTAECISWLQLEAVDWYITLRDF
jgi:hypothetical protein